ncbi:MAG: hypothetical protein DRI44_08725 [Chlamydiae bacterium]|nr:MAG: hypothetical protein DRI44_08725 [Chlamydiota bacterium]
MNSHSNKSALEIAVKLLAGRDFSKSEMEERLVRRGFDETDIQSAIQKLLKQGYIAETGNDRQKLCEMAGNYLRKKNTDKIEMKHLRSLEAFLIRKGFDTELVREYLIDLSEELC